MSCASGVPERAGIAPDGYTEAASTSSDTRAEEFSSNLASRSCSEWFGRVVTAVQSAVGSEHRVFSRRTAGSDVDEDLAGVRVRLHVAMRLGDVVQRESGVDHGPE